jgi:hypothetical protein
MEKHKHWIYIGAFVVSAIAGYVLASNIVTTVPGASTVAVQFQNLGKQFAGATS